MFFRRSLLFLLGLCLIGVTSIYGYKAISVQASGQHQSTSLSNAAAGPFKLVFDDEFNGKSIDKSKWMTYYGPQSGNATNAFNAKACVEANGEMQLKILKQNQDGRSYISCGFSTAKTNVQTYGKYEFRVRIDPGHNWGGVGLLWPQASHWPPEIDTCEYNTDSRNDCVFSLHYDSDNKWQGKHTAGDFTQWHVYTVEWTPGKLRWLIDGKLQFETTKAVPSEPMWFALQNGSEENPSHLGTYHVDWVHIYKYVG